MKHLNVASLTLPAALALIGLLTLLPQSGPPYAAFDWCVFCGAYGTANVLLNAILFMPLGAALSKNGASIARTTLLAALTTICIELLQLTVISGRHASLADILFNTVGGGAGWLLFHLWPILRTPRRLAAQVLVTLQLSAVLAIAVLTGAVFGSSPTDSDFWGQIAQRTRNRVAVSGTISEPQINREQLPSLLLPHGQGTRIRSALQRDSLELSATLIMQKPVDEMASILRIADSDGEEIAILGVQGIHAFFSVRTRATDLMLRQPSVVLANAFACDSCSGGFFPGRVSITGSRSGYLYELAVNGNGGTRYATVRVAPSLVWLALSPALGPLARTSGVNLAVSLAWEFLLWALLLYWAAQLPIPARRQIWLAVAAVVTLAIIKAGVPMLFAAPFDTGAAIASAAVGSAVGAVLGFRSARAGNAVREVDV